MSQMQKFWQLQIYDYQIYDYKQLPSNTKISDPTKTGRYCEVCQGYLPFSSLIWWYVILIVIIEILKIKAIYTFVRVSTFYWCSFCKAVMVNQVIIWIWVDDVLGLNIAADQLHSQTLTAEVQAYLLDLQRGTNSILFWLVHLILSILIQKTHSHTCKRVFSSAKETMSVHCNCISQELMEAL